MPVRAIFIPVISVARVFLKYQIAPRFICTDDEYIRFYISLLLLPSFRPRPISQTDFSKDTFRTNGKKRRIYLAPFLFFLNINLGGGIIAEKFASVGSNERGY